MTLRSGACICLQSTIVPHGNVIRLKAWRRSGVYVKNASGDDQQRTLLGSVPLRIADTRFARPLKLSVRAPYWQ